MTKTRMAALAEGVAAEERSLARFKRLGPAPGTSDVLRMHITLLSSESAALEELRGACLEGRLDAPRSQILRAGIEALAKLPPAELRAAVERVPRLSGAKIKCTACGWSSFLRADMERGTCGACHQWIAR